MHAKTFKIAFKSLQLLKSRTMWKLHFQTNATLSKNLKKNMTINLQKIGVLSATHLDYSGSMHTFDDCIKYIESTVGIGTHVKPVIFTLIIFAVY